MAEKEEEGEREGRGRGGRRRMKSMDCVGRSSERSWGKWGASVMAFNSAFYVLNGLNVGEVLVAGS